MNKKEFLKGGRLPAKLTHAFLPYVKISSSEVIYYDSLKKSLINRDTGRVIYEEKGDGDINIVDVLEGSVFFEDGREFGIEDFIREELGIMNFIFVN